MARLNSIELGLMNNPVRRAVQRVLELPSFVAMLEGAEIDLVGRRILDAGCGSGYSTRLIAERFHPARLLGMDLMEEQIERARGQGIDAEFRVGDLTETGEPDEAFDAVFVFGVLHHVSEWRAALREVGRVLAPDGVLLTEDIHGRAAALSDRFVGTSHPREAYFDWPSFRRGVHAAGFEIVDERALVFEAARSFLCRRTRGPS